MTDTLNQIAQTSGSKESRGRVAVVVPWVLTGLLIVANVATLTSERVHGAAFSALTSVAAVAGDAVADTMLVRSPTKAKARAVSDATRNTAAGQTD